MTLKIGQRVTVLPGVSPSTDEGTLQLSRRMGRGEEGSSRDHLVGKRGEIVQIGKDGPVLEGEARATCPPGYEDRVLVDSQVVNGKRQGMCEMREWFLPEELEVG